MQVVLEEGLEEGNVCLLALKLPITMVNFHEVKSALSTLQRKQLVMEAAQKNTTCVVMDLAKQLLLFTAAYFLFFRLAVALNDSINQIQVINEDCFGWEVSIQHALIEFHCTRFHFFLGVEV